MAASSNAYWAIKWAFVSAFKRGRHGCGDTVYVGEVFVTINAKQHYLWRAVDQEREVDHV